MRKKPFFGLEPNWSNLKKSCLILPLSCMGQKLAKVYFSFLIQNLNDSETIKISPSSPILLFLNPLSLGKTLFLIFICQTSTLS